LKKSGIKGLTVVLCEKICVSSCEIPGKVMWTHKSVRIYKARTVSRHPVTISLSLSTFSVYILILPLNIITWYICVSLKRNFKFFKFISQNRHPKSISYEYHASYLKTIGFHPINPHGISPATNSKFHPESSLILLMS
jgi:hypothetical protein